MSHRRAVWTMVLATLLWSIAGVVSRHFDSARSFEVTFWRSAFNALALLLWLSARGGPAALLQRVRGGGRALWLSAACWAVMYTAFMLALTLTDVANVLVTMAIGPLLTALLARWLLGHRLPRRTWAAIALAGAGIVWMHGHALPSATPAQWLGAAVALAVPLAAACNWTMLQHLKSRRAPPDMLAAVLLGALLSALVTLPLAWPLRASAHDLGLLALLGVVQLAVPCLMAVAAARVLSAPEVALLGLLEVVFGVLWTWLGAGALRSQATLAGGALVLLALLLNEALGAWRRRPTAPLARH